jgi:hypothetical protein
MGKESDLYNPYNTKTLGGDTRLDLATYENVQDSINVEKVNRQLLELTDLIGRVTNNRSNSGVIPETGVLRTESITASGYDNSVICMSPNEGEVLRLTGLSSTADTAPSSSITYLFVLKDRNAADTSFDAAIYLDSQASASTSVPFFGISTFLTNSAFEIAYPFQLLAYANAMQGTSSISVKTGTVRVR